MSEWNGKDITKMDTDHINNAINYLENRAKIAYEQEGEEVSNTLDSFRHQKYVEQTWYDYLPDVYYDLCKEKESRPMIDMRFNF
jgi:hypothetical protein